MRETPSLNHAKRKDNYVGKKDLINLSVRLQHEMSLGDAKLSSTMYPGDDLAGNSSFGATHYSSYLSTDVQGPLRLPNLQNSLAKSLLKPN